MLFNNISICPEDCLSLLPSDAKDTDTDRTGFVHLSIDEKGKKAELNIFLTLRIQRKQGILTHTGFPLAQHPQE